MSGEAAGPVERLTRIADGDGWVPLNASQRAMARRMRVAAEIPMAALFVDVDAGPALERIAQLQYSGVEATFTTIVVYVVAQQLLHFGTVAAEFDYPQNRFRIPKAIGVGVAVAAQRGLYVPVLHDAPRLSLEEVATQLHGLVQAARSNRLRPEMQSGAHFTVTNIGGMGIHGGVPIVNPPQNAILGVASVREQPIIRQGALAIGMTTSLTLSIDHRAIDGLTAARFLTAVGAALEASGDSPEVAGA
jgi:pyruvate/2-oxoglutarate dehydrogenase complex dihydrolipoamide acyltransferase (E2) component